ncbi:hypothetical protein DAEQUDRAFT_769839 [Daedalea quercina L-15889]|uniref:C3H1-type domain-containing protein n=1 Tax=Daedalea quercina L-15889 TaxID=1314783 RepID=A0A165LDK1_9APHY|nr:hypothetical protein DAEQUDRAFT_769839 [Daedalea quercina L-15889]
MLRNPLPSFAEGQTVFSASHRGIRSGREFGRSVSPHSRLGCPGIEVPLDSPPPLHSEFLVWNPKTRGLEPEPPQPPVSPHFVGRSRFPSEVSTISTTSTESSGFWGDASDREDEVEDVIFPPVPPPTPFAIKGDATENEPVEEHPPLPASTTIEYIDRPAAFSRFSSAEYSSLWRRSKDNLYKTKPCKFYYKDKSCIKGDKCNFIHDEWDHAYQVPRPRVERRAGPPSAPVTTPGRRLADGGAREPHPTTPRPTELCILPQKPDNVQKPRSPNFYPITWRVIGGGVMMGGKREICQDFMAGHCHEGTDCKLAHPGDDEADSSLNTLPSYISPLSPVLEEPAYTTFNDLSTLVLHQASTQPSVLSTPVLSAPAIAARASPHQTEERRRRGRRARKPLTIFPPPLSEQPELVGYSAHRVLDGSTLIEYEASPPLAAEIPSLSPDYLDTTVSVARSLVRPLSTPPSLNLPRPQVAKLFAAEMP